VAGKLAAFSLMVKFSQVVHLMMDLL